MYPFGPKPVPSPRPKPESPTPPKPSGSARTETTPGPKPAEYASYPASAWIAARLDRTATAPMPSAVGTPSLAPYLCVVEAIERQLTVEEHAPVRTPTVFLAAARRGEVAVENLLAALPESGAPAVAGSAPDADARRVLGTLRTRGSSSPERVSAMCCELLGARVALGHTPELGPEDSP